jgi:hypothetical protein
MKLINKEVFNEDGEMVKIVFSAVDGGHVIDAVWDEQDPHDEEHRIAFRQWAYRIMRQKGYEVE